MTSATNENPTPAPAFDFAALARDAVKTGPADADAASLVDYAAAHDEHVARRLAMDPAQNAAASVRAIMDTLVRTQRATVAMSEQAQREGIYANRAEASIGMALALVTFLASNAPPASAAGIIEMMATALDMFYEHGGRMVGGDDDCEDGGADASDRGGFTVREYADDRNPWSETLNEILQGLYIGTLVHETEKRARENRGGGR